MRCPECSHNQRFRSGMICAKCHYHFVLNPKEAPFCADKRFVKGIETASDGGTRWYTSNQLHGAIFRRRNRGFFRRFFSAPGSSAVAATAQAVALWERHQRDLHSIIRRPELEPLIQDAAWSEPDLFDYGAEAVLAVDDRVLVDLLVRNQVHTTAKIVIVEGRTGYPAPIPEHARPLVAARRDLPIFLLHSASTEAASTLERQTRALLAADHNPVIDLGLAVDAATRVPGMRWARNVRPLLADMLPHRLLTDGVAAAIANRISLDELLHPPKDAGDSDAVPWILWGDHDGDDDFG